MSSDFLYVSNFNPTGQFSVLKIKRTPGKFLMEITNAPDLPDKKPTIISNKGRSTFRIEWPGNRGRS